MKCTTFSSGLVTMGACLLLCGCATMGGSAARGPSKYDSDVDVAKVVTVNQWAQWRGAKLIWINYPQKSRLADSESTAN